jgi:hypothetical protein
MPQKKIIKKKFSCMTATMPQNNFEAVFVTPFYMSRDTHFTFFTSTLVQILTPVLLLQAF